jgi:hypothetical protein
MEELKLNIYADDGKTLVKTYTAKDYNVAFGVVRRLMKLLDLEKLNNNADILKLIVNAWDELEKVLSGYFPDVQDDEWDRVSMDEIVVLIIAIATNVVKKVASVPTDGTQKKIASN